MTSYNVIMVQCRRINRDGEVEEDVRAIRLPGKRSNCKEIRRPAWSTSLKGLTGIVMIWTLQWVPSDGQDIILYPRCYARDRDRAAMT